MKVFEELSGLAEAPAPICVAIGVFDGVHLGHRELVLRAMREARLRDGSAVVLTFHPHPARILRPESAPHLLTSTPHKIRLIAELGCPFLLKLPFDDDFSRQPPEAFIERLAAAGRLHAVCVGRDWAFGKDRAGSVSLLRGMGSRLGFETIEIAPVMVDGELVSSTRIRKAIEAGDLATARKFLGREYTILGTVRHGDGLGGRIGFPTANLAAHNEQFPPDGVYAVHVSLRGRWHGGVANIGTRPTVQKSAERGLEVHVFDFASDCYGEDAEVRFLRFLRPEQKFASLEELRSQIQRDAQEARQLAV